MTDPAGSGPEDGPVQVSATEDGPAAPGWLEPEVDKAFASLPVPAEKLRRFRDSYLDCLASAPRGEDLDSAHDACRLGLLRSLRDAFPLSDAQWDAFSRMLEKTEAALTEDL